MCIVGDGDGGNDDDDVVDDDNDGHYLFYSAKFVTVRQLLSFLFVSVRSMVMVEHILKRSYRFPTT